MTPETIARAKRQLAELYGPEVRTMVLPGHPVREVRRYAVNHQVGLVVMGEQARAVEQNYGERLADQLPCPLLVLYLPAEHQQDDPIAPRPTPSLGAAER